TPVLQLGFLPRTNRTGKGGRGKGKLSAGAKQLPRCKRIGDHLSRPAGTHSIGNRDQRSAISHVSGVQLSAVGLYHPDERANVPRRQIRWGQSRLRLAPPCEEYFQIVEATELLLCGLEHLDLGAPLAMSGFC